MGQKAVLVFNHCQNLSITNVNITGGYYGYGLMLLNTMGLLDNTNLVDGIILNCTTNIDFSCAGSGLIIVFKDTVVTVKESNDYSELYFTNTNAESITSVKNNINNITIGDFKSSHWTIGSIAGGMLIIFLKGMRNSHVHVSNSVFAKISNLPISPSQDGGSALSIHSFHCIKLYVPRDLSYHHFHPIYLNQVFFVINGNPVNNPYAPSSSQNLIKYGGAMYINIHDTSDDNYAIYIKMSTFDGNFATSAGSGFYAIVNDNVKKI